MDEKNLLWFAAGFRTVNAWRDAMFAHGYSMPMQLCHGLTDAVHTVVITEQGTKNAASSGFKWHLESFELCRWRKCGYEVESVDAQGTLQRGSEMLRELFS